MEVERHGELQLLRGGAAVGQSPGDGLTAWWGSGMVEFRRAAAGRSLLGWLMETYRVDKVLGWLMGPIEWIRKKEREVNIQFRPCLNMGCQKLSPLLAPQIGAKHGGQMGVKVNWLQLRAKLVWAPH